MTNSLEASPPIIRLGLAFALSPAARADSLSDVFTRGNGAFLRGDYASAIREYEALSAFTPVRE